MPQIIHEFLDLNEQLIKNETATFFVRVSGDSMIGAGIFSGDILIVDRSLEPKHDSVIIAVVNGELTVKRLIITEEGVQLNPENIKFAPIILSSLDELECWGVVSNVIHALV